ncbi:MAG: 1-deoxy-D-xylulose-5-phosphate reductoisomerase [Planctomycetaceae bacterium]|nr:1-deoxy-D-xylulose-5-phosphate reductoisomerase [Planctomycetaceae bacterium]
MQAVSSVAVLGATGSIGTSCLDVIRRHRSRMRAVGLTAYRNSGLLRQQVAEFQPDWAILDSQCRGTFIDDSPTRWHFDLELVCDFVRRPDVDVVVSAMVGAAGLPATVAAVDAGKRVALANKETMVVAGAMVMNRAAETGATIIPVDSEHSAVYQCLQSGRPAEVKRVVLTASGGPFRGWTRSQLQTVTPQMALKHPTWQMGRKITIDSATMMNKALEIIEARWLFGLSRHQLAVVIHPQSVIHSLVEFADGAVITQMSPPDMRLPIQYALTYPSRLDCPAPSVDWASPMNLELSPPDFDTFPALRLGFEVAEAGGSAGVVLNAANEVAVERFLNLELRFDQITQVAEEILRHHQYDASPGLHSLMQLDGWARKEALRWTP